MLAERLPESELVVMEAAHVVNGNQPRTQDWRELWSGHHARVLACQPIFVSKFASGAGGACKYMFNERTEWEGKVVHKYHHCQGRFPVLWILIHNGRPTIVVRQHVITRDDGLAKAISWEYSSTGNFITACFYYASASSMHL